MSGAELGTEYLTTSVEALWPEGRARVTRRPGRGDDLTWWILPSQRRPRMLVPMTVPSAATMLRRHDARRRDAVARRIVETAISTGALRWVPAPRLRVGPGGGVVEHLESLLGRPVTVGVLLGSDRPNRKPVLRIFSAHGETVGFLKAAHEPVAELVRAEARALRSITSAAQQTALLEVPHVLHSGRWSTLELLLLSPLQASEARGSTDDPEVEAALEVAALLGLSERSVPELSAGLEERIASANNSTLAPAAAHLDRLVERSGDRRLLTGAWHGDWAPWNVGRHGGRVQAWDWERFATGVPVGYDVVHHRAQLLWRDSTRPADCRAALLAAARDMLGLAGRPVTDADHVVSLYLVEILLRYVKDQPHAGPVRPRTRWLLEQLDTSSPPPKA